MQERTVKGRQCRKGRNGRGERIREGMKEKASKGRARREGKKERVRKEPSPHPKSKHGTFWFGVAPEAATSVVKQSINEA
jgi:hypothetical protein